MNSDKASVAAAAAEFAIPAYYPPDLTAERLAHIERAAVAFARRHSSDPFAYGRIKTHMLRGIAHPDQVVADSRISSSPSVPTG